MPAHLVKQIAVLATLLAFLPARRAQTSPSSASHSANSQTFDPHDLAGVWNPMVDANGIAIFLKGVTLTPWAREKLQAEAKARIPEVQPYMNSCDPMGIPRLLLDTRPMEFVQAPGKVIVIYEEQHTWRFIYTDGRPLATSAGHLPFGPTWLGYAVGHWEGDDFVVDTVGMNDKTGLDDIGHLHSEDLHLTERYHRVDRDTLEMSFTIDDPKAYTKPWTYGPIKYEHKTGQQWEIQESFCILAEQQQFYKQFIAPTASGQTPP